MLIFSLVLVVVEFLAILLFFTFKKLKTYLGPILPSVFPLIALHRPRRPRQAGRLAGGLADIYAQNLANVNETLSKFAPNCLDCNDRWHKKFF